VSAAPVVRGGTTIFGIRVGADPKILVGGLIALALLIYWYNSRGDEQGGGTPAGAPHAQGTAAPLAARSRIAARSRVQNERGTLRLRPVEGGRGDIDPTLRLDLLERVRGVRAETAVRNLFEEGAAVAQNLPAIPKMAPMIPKPLAAAPNTMMPTNLNLTVHIPFKYYGFARPSLQGDANRGFFMEGDNILVAAEGDVLEKRYLIVALTPNTAKVEDTQLKQGQDLAVTPEATAQ
jgi:hypothetical protein